MSSTNNNEERYLLDDIHSRILDNNPLNSPADRKVHVYLPPDYFTSSNRSYPVVYMLHGYSGTGPIIMPHIDDSLKVIVENGIISEEDLEQFTYQGIDQQILSDNIKPFILVQPDASLHLTALGGAPDYITGQPRTKGSFYVNSPYTGNYEDYIVFEIINYIDSKYRTIPDRMYRGLIGGSMGGYGALTLSLNHPDKFSCVASLSPANISLQSLSIDVLIPFVKELLGDSKAREIGMAAWNDILDTRDMLHSHDHQLLPTCRFGEDGSQLMSYDEVAAESWAKFDVNYMIRHKPDAFQGVELMLCCEIHDEFGLAQETAVIHETLLEKGIAHKYDLFDLPKAAFSPHTLGIGYKNMEAVKFCLLHMNQS